ncbi:MAG: hypothetical protein ACKVOK_15975 [Flavobacteriales bacterium]
MKIYFLIIPVALILFTSMIASNKKEQDTTTIQSTDIGSSVKIIGQAGLELGTIAKIKCKIIDGESTHTKDDQGRFLLELISVNGTALSQLVEMNFEDESGKLPSTTTELYEFILGQKFKSANSTELTNLKRDYVGKEFEIIAYETGGFGGIPDGYFDYKPPVAATGYGFSTHLVVLQIPDK